MSDHNVVALADEVKLVAGEFARRLNQDPQVPGMLKGWERLLILRPKSSEKCDPVYVTTGSGSLEVRDAPVPGLRTVEIAAIPSVVIEVCLGKKSLARAFAMGEIEIVRGSLSDLLRTKALLDCLRTIQEMQPPAE
jgi:hypothetical protein